jgi:hypothetical protein
MQTLRDVAVYDREGSDYERSNKLGISKVCGASLHGYQVPRADCAIGKVGYQVKTFESIERCP